MKNLSIGVNQMENNKCIVSICAVNSKYIHSSLSVWCLFTSIKQECSASVEKNVFETTINANQDEILSKLKATSSTLVALSCYIWNIAYIKTLIPKIKSILPNTKILLGGPEVSYNCNDFLRANPLVDYIISGEGEQPIAQLVNHLNGENIDINAIEGLCHKGNIDTVINPCISTSPSPTPYCEEYFSTLTDRIVYLETSRGCPYSCAFCLSGRCGNVRFFDLDRAKNEMILLANSGTQTVKLVDRTFNCNRKRAKELWQFVIDNYGDKIPTGVCFHFEIAGDILDAESIAILNSAPSGCIQLEIGMQSFYEPTLAAINRKTDTVILRKNIEKLLSTGNIHIHIDLIAGLPLETYDIFKQSFDIAYALKSHMLQLGFLKILHGAKLEETATEHGIEYAQTPPYEIVKNTWITKPELDQLRFVEDAIDRFYNSSRFTYTLDYIESVYTGSMFAFYHGIGLDSQKHTVQKISLDDYTAIVFDYLKTLPNVDTAKLRDALVLDRLCSNRTGKLPKCLQIQDKTLKKVVRHLAEDPLTAQPKNIVRGVAILYSQNKIIWVDYEPQTQDTVTKKWQPNFLSWDI